jgi:predicted ATP-binding protein involved in virulence
MINRYFEIEKEWAHNYKQNWDWIIGNLNVISPYGDNFTFKEIKKDLEPVFLLNGKECYLEELSAGFQSVLSLIFAIVEWIESINEENNILIQQAEGTVFIDELDVHLHPEWQIIVRNMLDKMFPKLQFVLTTHSPHLIASAQSGEIIKIPSGEDTINIRSNDKSYSGWSTDEILEDVMEVKNLENKEYNMVLKKTMEYIANRDIVNIKRSIEKLEQIVHPNNTIVIEMKIKLAELILEE